MKTTLSEVSLVVVFLVPKAYISALPERVLGFHSFDKRIPYYAVFLYSLIAVCQNCWALIMNLFSKTRLLPSRWLLTSIHWRLLSVSCGLLVWGIPQLFLLQPLNEHFELWTLFSLWGQGHKFLRVSPYTSTHVRETEEISFRPPQPTVLSPGRSEKLSQCF